MFTPEEDSPFFKMTGGGLANDLANANDWPLKGISVHF